MQRRFSVSDTFILIAATALGLSPMQFIDSSFDLRPPIRRTQLAAYIAEVSVQIVPILIAWTFAALLLIIRKPRPSMRRLARRPGFVACIVAITVCTERTTLFVIENILKPAQPISFDETHYSTFAVRLPVPVGVAVVGAWSAMARGRGGSLGRIGLIGSVASWELAGSHSPGPLTCTKL